MVRLVRRCDGRGWLVAVLPCLFLAGCGTGGDDGIKTYKVATPQQRDKPREQPDDKGTPVPDGPPKVRFLGAVIPVAGGDSYFVRFAAPLDIEKIDANEKDFDAFLNSIRVPGEGGKPISWTVPAGWKEGPANSNRVVTIQKVGGGSSDVYISNPFGGGLLMNVNSWRTDFVGIKAVTEAELPTVAKEIMLGTTKAYRVDFRGPGGKGRR